MTVDNKMVRENSDKMSVNSQKQIIYRDLSENISTKKLFEKLS